MKFFPGWKINIFFSKVDFWTRTEKPIFGQKVGNKLCSRWLKKKWKSLKKNMNLSQLLVIERSQHKKINREIYTCVSILLFAADCNLAGQAWYGIQLYTCKHRTQPCRFLLYVYTCTCTAASCMELETNVGSLNSQ